MLKRFYRLERSRHTLGNGLDLSLVAAVAKMHDAQIEMLDNGPGVVFQLWFRRSTGTSLRNSCQVRSFGDQPIRFACAAYSPGPKAAH